MPIVRDALTTLAALCAAPGGLASGAGIALALMLAGLAGGTMHCLPMCGPIVLGQVSDRLARVPRHHLCEAQRLRAGLLLPYHIGRIATYAALGAAAATLGGSVAALPWFRWTATALLALGAALFLAQAARGLFPAWARRSPWTPAARSAVGAIIGRVASRLRPDGAIATALLGVVLGFLPCGFLYSALAASAASGSAATGALAMAGFGVGTVPSLIVAGVAGHAAARRWRGLTARVAPAILALNAVVLGMLAVGSMPSHFADRAEAGARTFLLVNGMSPGPIR